MADNEDGEACEDCHVQTERIKNLAHWINVGEALPELLLPHQREAVAQEILKLVSPLPYLIGCDRCGHGDVGKLEDFSNWKLPVEDAFDNVTLCPNCQKETETCVKN